jgi:glycosyltransferase involved in cell wall biosynthesis
MKIIHIPRRYTRRAWGGTETCIRELANHQVRHGHSVAIKTSLALSDQRYELDNGVAISRFDYCYPYLGLGKASQRRMDLCGGNMLSLPLLRNLAGSPKPDIIHLHTGKRIGAIGRTVARRFGIPYIVSLHGGMLDVPDGFTQGQQPLVTRGEWGKAFGALLGARRVLEDADAIFCVNQVERKRLLARFPGKRVEYVPNGVDCAAFASGEPEPFRVKFHIPSHRRILLNVGRIDPQKNQHLLVEALASLSRTDLHLVLIGPVTDEPYAEHLRQLIQNSRQSSRVTLIEGLAPEDPMLAAAYKAATLFCLPSVHEPFGIVALEAWAAGTPVLASPVGGLRDLVQPGLTGIHVENSLPAWRHSIDKAIADPNTMQRISDHALGHVRAHYDWSAVSATIASIYEDLISEKRVKAA